MRRQWIGIVRNEAKKLKLKHTGANVIYQLNNFGQGDKLTQCDLTKQKFNPKI